MSLIKQYMSILNEEKSFTSSGVAVDNTGELEGAEKAKASSLPKNSGPEAAEVEKPVKGPHSEAEEDALPKAVSSESKNPFDLLYNKILAEEAFGDEAGDTFDFEGEIEDHGSDDLGLEDESESEEGTEEHEEEEEEGLEAVLDHLKNAVATLEKLVSAEEHEEEDELNLGGEEEAEGVETAEESVEAEYEGHALVDQEKLEKGLNKASSHQVKGAVPVSKKKAEVVKGKKADGEPEELHADCETLTGKGKQDVGGVKAGKGLFDQ